MSLDATFDEALREQRLRPLDVAFARFLAERDAQAPAALLWLAAVLSRQLADGHLCLDLAQLDALAAEQDWPPAWRAFVAALHAGLPGSPLLAQADGEPANAPLVLGGTRLYLRRYWNHERAVAQGILDRVERGQPTSPSLAAELARLFPTAAPDWQRIACALAARAGFGVLTGGPGTGKTTTVVRLLGLLQTLHLREHADEPLRIRLAAPTGKAAARLGDAITRQLATLDVDAAVRASIPAEVTTLHRLLGARPDTRRFRHDRANPLHLDVLVIDEASMVDLEMMAAVLAALPAPARLILLGDKDQLSSVEAGAVLGDLCRRAEDGHYDDATARWLAATSGDDVTDFVKADAQPLDQCIAMLRVSHRFDTASGIGQLARAVNAGDAPAALTLLRTPANDLDWWPGADTATLDTLAVDGYRPYLDSLRAGRPTATDEASLAAWATGALAAFNGFQLLCALRQGPHGMDGLNRRIAAALQARGLIEASQGWYEGRPVLTTRNDYALGLMNGDIGLCLRLPADGGGSRLMVAFLAMAAGGGTRLRFVAPSRLSEVETAYALTVHKSQGSEFTHTALLLPPDSGPVLTRELLYTGVTRARERFSLVGSEPVIVEAMARRTRRHSGLAERLQRG